MTRKHICAQVVLSFLLVCPSWIGLSVPASGEHLYEWQILGFSFGAEQLKNTDSDFDELIIMLEGEDRGWGARKMVSGGDTYEIEWFSEMTIPKVVLTQDEYTIFSDLYRKEAISLGNSLTIMVEADDPHNTQYYEYAVKIDNMTHLYATAVVVEDNVPTWYDLKITAHDQGLPLLRLDAAGYEEAIDDIVRFGRNLLLDIPHEKDTGETELKGVIHKFGRQNPVNE